MNTIRIENKEKQIVIYASADKIEMATFWRKNGKIWVVIAVVAILFTVVIGYLFYLDRKISRIS
ncbi:MAG: CcmD family protein [Candidatus Competibacteraceae bacterium]|nr:CcmD family protein [Candidatus Competibacteraceae bacterium]